MLAISRRKALTEVLDGLQTTMESDRGAQLVRVTTLDGTAVQGELNSASPLHVSLILAGTGERLEISAANIATIYLAVPNRGREWLLATAGIGAGTAALVGLSLLPGVSLTHSAQTAFGVVYLAGLGALHLLLRTRLREWLTRWELMFRAGNA